MEVVEPDGPGDVAGTGIAQGTKTRRDVATSADADAVGSLLVLVQEAQAAATRGHRPEARKPAVQRRRHADA